VSERRIFLFDVDGVIVNPIAYRLGVNKTLSALCEKIGLANIDSVLPTEADISAMEAQGVHDVWDITNIVFCYILTEIALKAENTNWLITENGLLPTESIELVPQNTSEVLYALRSLNPAVARPAYLELANKMAVTETLSHPPDIAMTLFHQRLATINTNAKWIELLKRFLIGTRSAYSSYGTCLFQNIILGSEDFERTYNLVSEYSGPGLLRTEDITLIRKETVDQLKLLSREPANAVGIYTARPSLPPRQAETSPVGYSPEAEIALENADMQSFPLIGMGMMEWLGKQHGERTEDLTKPNATQALAALINTITDGQDVTALEQAYAIDKLNKDPGETSLYSVSKDKTTVYVFEDTISGIVPLKKTVQMLQSKGFDMHLKPLGIAVDPTKKEALERHCEKVFADVNEAFQSIR
jgi:hypothetical protein